MYSLALTSLLVLALVSTTIVSIIVFSSLFSCLHCFSRNSICYMYSIKIISIPSIHVCIYYLLLFSYSLFGHFHTFGHMFNSRFFSLLHHNAAINEGTCTCMIQQTKCISQNSHLFVQYFYFSFHFWFSFL